MTQKHKTHQKWTYLFLGGTLRRGVAIVHVGNGVTFVTSQSLIERCKMSSLLQHFDNTVLWRDFFIKLLLFSQHLNYIMPLHKSAFTLNIYNK